MGVECGLDLIRAGVRHGPAAGAFERHLQLPLADRVLTIALNDTEASDLERPDVACLMSDY